MRGTLIDTYYETLDYCFDTVLGDMLGGGVRDTIVQILEKKGIPRREISTRFDDAVEVMINVLGACSRVIVLRTIAEMCKQYSQRMDFSYQDSLRDRLSLLKESVLANHLVPRRASTTADLEGAATIENGANRAGQDHGTMYPPKKGVKSS